MKLKELKYKNITWIEDFREGYAFFIYYNKGHLYGMIDKKFNIIIEPIYEKLQINSEKLIGFWNGVSWGFINRKGKQIIEPQFYDINSGFKQGLCAVRKNKDSKYGFINKKGIFKLPPIYNVAFNFSCSRAKVAIDGNWYFINRRGKIITEALNSYHGV